MSDEIIKMRPNGGQLVHGVPKGKQTALCGFEPGRLVKLGRRMRRRDGWRELIDQSAAITCRFCRIKVERRNPEDAPLA